MAILSLWRPASMGSSVPVSITVTLCKADKRGGIEQAHTMLRMILPKGTSFEFLTQWDVNQIVNHINSTPRECLEGRTPYSVALETFGEDALNAFQLKPIDPDKVNLPPKLIRFNH